MIERPALRDLPGVRVTGQGGLPFDDDEPRALARREDPGTSKAAALSIRAEELSRMYDAILEVLRSRSAGATTLELDAALPQYDRVSISPRMRPMATLGLVVESGVRKGPSGRSSIVWQVVA